MWVRSDGKEGTCLYRDTAFPSEVNLRYALLNNALFRRTSFLDLDFSWSTLHSASFEVPSLGRSTFDHIQGYRLNIQAVDAIDTSWRNAVLNGANFRAATLRNADFTGARLAGANFVNADLRGACFTDAHLKDVFGDGKYIKTLILAEYMVTYTATHMWIGCQSLSLEKWETIGIGEVIDMCVPMEYAQQWKKHKKYILNTIAEYPAEAFDEQN